MIASLVSHSSNAPRRICSTNQPQIGSDHVSDLAAYPVTVRPLVSPSRCSMRMSEKRHRSSTVPLLLFLSSIDCLFYGLHIHLHEVFIAAFVRVHIFEVADFVRAQCTHDVHILVKFTPRLGIASQQPVQGEEVVILAELVLAENFCG